VTFLAWLIRAIILTVIINMVFRLLTGGRPSSGPRRPAAPRPTPPRQTERQGGTLVRDPHCGTYIPESRAIRVGSGSSAQYFCSDTCRTAYAAAQSRGDAAAS
jgi:hypothetical protein